MQTQTYNYIHKNLQYIFIRYSLVPTIARDVFFKPVTYGSVFKMVIWHCTVQMYHNAFN